MSRRADIALASPVIFCGMIEENWRVAGSYLAYYTVSAGFFVLVLLSRLSRVVGQSCVLAFVKSKWDRESA